MIHTQVYGFFQTCLPDQAKEVKEYFPNGKNSIRIRKTNGQEFIFSEVFAAPKLRCVCLLRRSENRGLSIEAPSWSPRL